MEKIKAFAVDHKYALLAVLLVFTPAVGFAFGFLGFVLRFVFGIISWKGVAVVIVFCTVHGAIRLYRWSEQESDTVGHKSNKTPFEL